VGFIGKEWKRKGLHYVKEIMLKLLITRRDLELLVLGPCHRDVEVLFRGYPGKLSIKGWVASEDIFQSIDVLLHPALEEPYGMVIAEAMAANVPVVISNHCGAAQSVTPDRGSVLGLNAELDLWASEVNNWLNNRRPMPGFCRPWSDVANEHLKIYEEVKFNQS
jgi:UDP-glucose:(heptosyl)LPS alpha-1,3-glucosyltransferase